MNISELARRLKISPKELKEILPKLGFDVGMRAIQVDDSLAKRIIRDWEDLIRKFKKEKVEEEKGEEKKKKEEKIFIPSYITVHNFAFKLGISVVKVIKELMKNGIIASINDRIDFETASIIASDLGFKIEKGEEEMEKEKKREKVEEIIKKEKKLEARPPVVVVVGHIDHGKTSLLDAIRETKVVSMEEGGITQHIGAYQAKKGERIITFIDTPGHEAFKTMRQRGGQVADLAILVIAADDSVQEQTLESIKIIQEENLPFIVAINKIDRPNADIEKIKKQLSEINLIPEDWGGKIICVPVSAKTKQGLDDLLEMVLLVGDMEKERLQANPEGELVATIIEAHLDKGGPMATVLIQNGSLKTADLILAGEVFGKVKAMYDWQGFKRAIAIPGMPVRVLGFKIVPKIGDLLKRVRDKKELKEKIKEYKKLAKPISIIKIEKKEFLNLILKADVLGSLEAITEALEKIKHPEVGINIIRKGLGNITEGNILEAETTKSIIIGFNVEIAKEVKVLAEEKNIEFNLYNIIYDLILKVKEKLTKLLSQEIIEKEIGKIRVLTIFRVMPNFMIIGGKVEKGKAEKNALIKIIKDNKILLKSKILQLQIQKNEVEEVKEGLECGIKIAGKNDLEINNILEVFKEERKERKLNEYNHQSFC